MNKYKYEGTWELRTGCEYEMKRVVVHQCISEFRDQPAYKTVRGEYKCSVCLEVVPSKLVEIAVLAGVQWCLPSDSTAIREMKEEMGI